VRHCRLGAHTKTDLKVRLAWIPKYRKAALTGEVAIRVRDLLRQIAAEQELEIVSGKVARDHVHLFVSYRANQQINQIIQWLRGSARVCCCRNIGRSTSIDAKCYGHALPSFRLASKPIDLRSASS
jgi:REP element-mobilizing transposase RayT